MIKCEPSSSNLGLQVIAGGQSYNFNRRDIKLLGYAGTGLMDISRIYQKAPAQRGATDRGFSQAVRPLTLVWRIYGRSLPHYYDQLRTELEVAMQPRVGDPILITFNVPGKGKRAAYVNMRGSLDFLPSDRTYTMQTVSVVVEAGDIRLFDPVQKVVTFFPALASGLWLIPWTIDWTIGSPDADNTVSINYANGSKDAAQEFPIIKLFGPIVDPIITNVTTNERLAFEGLTLGADGAITINLAGGPFVNESPKIRDAKGNSVEHLLTNDNDLGTWHLAPAGELLFDGTRATGENRIRVQGQSVDANTQLQVIYFDQYIGF